MPRPKKSTAVEPLKVLETAPQTEPARELTPEERIELRQMLNHPAFIRAWALAESKKPSVFLGDYESALGAQHSLARLHELRGWQLHQRAFLASVADPVKPPVMPSMRFAPDDV